jgi:hypothetical protein
LSRESNRPGCAAIEQVVHPDSKLACGRRTTLDPMSHHRLLPIPVASSQSHAPDPRAYTSLCSRSRSWSRRASAS